jgi:hypothetical protein
MFTARKTEDHEGFSIRFANGYTISVQFGNGNYCTRDSIGVAESAEIAIWDKDRTWYNFGMDLVKGWCSADEVSSWMNKVKQLEYTGDMFVLSDKEGNLFENQYQVYVYDNEDEAREDCWGHEFVPIQVKNLSSDVKTKVLSQELNKIIIHY